HRYRVSRRGLRDCVVLICVGENGAAPIEASETALELRCIPLEVVGTHLIDGDEDDQRRRGAALCDDGRCESCGESNRGQRRPCGTFARKHPFVFASLIATASLS